MLSRIDLPLRNALCSTPISFEMRCVILMSNEEEKRCPLCGEEMDLTAQKLKPCKCGYEESVGGNSKTVMIDHEGETTVNNTLKYASLAFKNKNKPIVNNVGNRVGNRVGNMVGLRLQTMRYEIGSLKNIIETLQAELSKKEVDSIEEMNAMREEKRALEASVQEKDAVIETLRNEIEILQKKVQTILGKEKEVDHCECSSRATCVRGCECVQQNRLCSTSCSCIVRKCLNRDDKEKAEYAAKLLQNAAKGLVSEM
ncbi:uncharacterized protein [Rutidosis leptorrhynchoides]|uniref:uncharacterized protein n=1 Tax=Rutidosis leptorrhynchoides TaxID=125765 RepID=UPI003A9966D2